MSVSPMYPFTKDGLRNSAPTGAGVYTIWGWSPSSQGDFAIYVGEAENIWDRLRAHHSRESDESECIWEHTPQYFSFQLVRSGQQARLRRETDLRRERKPRCNPLPPLTTPFESQGTSPSSPRLPILRRGE